jgi:predicted GNAT family N-acyltransferase
VGAFLCRGTYIGTIRLIPMDRGLAPCETVLQGQSLVPAHYYDASWEVGRLVVAPQYRTGPEALKRCLFLALLYLVRNTEIENLFATCNPVLGRLYRRFGFSVLVKNACEGATESYSLIHGDVPTVMRALAGSEEEKALAEIELALLAAPQKAYG